MEDVTNELPKVIAKIPNPPSLSPTIENEEESDGLDGGRLEIIIPSNLIEI